MWFKRLIRYAWASPATAIGLLIVTAAALCGGAKLRRVDGVLEMAGGRLLGAVPYGRDNAPIRGWPGPIF